MLVELFNIDSLPRIYCLRRDKFQIKIGKEYFVLTTDTNKK